MTSALSLILPCPRCGAGAGDSCVRRDGGPRKQPHTGRTPKAPCGTYGGYVGHVKAKEVACDGCREAARRYKQEYRNRRPEVRDNDIALLRARRRAEKRLIDNHRDEFQRLMIEEVTA